MSTRKADRTRAFASVKVLSMATLSDKWKSGAGISGGLTRDSDIVVESVVLLIGPQE